jgi:hypothetical protein
MYLLELSDCRIFSFLATMIRRCLRAGHDCEGAAGCTVFNNLRQIAEWQARCDVQTHEKQSDAPTTRYEENRSNYDRFDSKHNRPPVRLFSEIRFAWALG